MRARENAISVVGGSTFSVTNVIYDGKSGMTTFTKASHGLSAPTAVTAGAGTTYSPTVGILTVTANNHGFSNGDLVKLEDGAITFSCDLDNRATTHPYPRYGDPASKKYLPISNVTTNTFRLDVGTSSNTSQHYFEAGATGGVKKANSIVGIATTSIVFTCTQDNNSTEHAYPRTTDYAHNRNLGVDSVTTDTFAVYVGVSSSGGLVAPLQMEFIASILENSTT